MFIVFDLTGIHPVHRHRNQKVFCLNLIALLQGKSNHVFSAGHCFACGIQHYSVLNEKICTFARLASTEVTEFSKVDEMEVIAG